MVIIMLEILIVVEHFIWPNLNTVFIIMEMVEQVQIYLGILQMEIILHFLLYQEKGYTFDKWIDQGTGWESSTDWIVCGGNYTEIAQWIANQYNVSFDDNGADSGNVSDSTATYDSNFTLPESGYKKKGYKFWVGAL